MLTEDITTDLLIIRKPVDIDLGGNTLELTDSEFPSAYIEIYEPVEGYTSIPVSFQNGNIVDKATGVRTDLNALFGTYVEHEVVDVELYLDNVTITANPGNYAMYCYGLESLNIANSTITGMCSFTDVGETTIEPSANFIGNADDEFMIRVNTNLTIKGGMFDANGTQCIIDYSGSHANDLVINGGTFIAGDEETAMENTVMIKATKENFTINGGTFTGNCLAIIGIYDRSPAAIINGGTFTNTNTTGYIIYSEGTMYSSVIIGYDEPAAPSFTFGAEGFLIYDNTTPATSFNYALNNRYKIYKGAFKRGDETSFTTYTSDDGVLTELLPEDADISETTNVAANYSYSEGYYYKGLLMLTAAPTGSAT